MNSNTFGNNFKFHSFGESHGLAIGVIIEGCPSGVPFSLEDLKKELVRRRPGQWPWVSSRKELDEPEVLSGVFEGKTLGTPIAILVRNTNAKSEDYKDIKNNFRKGHADDLWNDKFINADLRGGGRASGRETVGRVMAGSVARMFLKQSHSEFKVMAFVKQIGIFKLENKDFEEAESLITEGKTSDIFPACFPSSKKSKEIEKYLMDCKEKGESVGSLVELWMENLPRGLGQPVFHKFKSDLARGLMSLGASVGFEIGRGFVAGSKHGEDFHKDSKNYGGIRGGLTTGERIELRVAFKPPSSLGSFAKKGRHDPCIGPRAVPVVESMACLVTADHILQNRLDNVT